MQHAVAVLGIDGVRVHIVGQRHDAPEAAGLDKQDMTIEARDDALVISGEKRFERESTEGRWRVMQCAYGSFRRVVPLNVPVLADKANASYKNGVLRVELPKAAPGTPKSVTIRVK